MTSQIAAAYTGVAQAWDAGPSRLYDRLAEAIVEHCPQPLADKWVLDVGAGTGAVSRALQRRGAHPVGLDAAPDMVATMRANGLEAAAGDMVHMPFEDDAFDGTVAACSLSHAEDPVAALGEMRRVVRDGGFVVTGGFAATQQDESKAAVDAAAQRFGYEYPPWYVHFKEVVEPQTGTADALRRFAESAGLRDVAVAEQVVDTGIASAADIVSVRFGMAQLAPWVATLSEAQREALIADAIDALGPHPDPMRPRLLVMTSRVSRAH